MVYDFCIFVCFEYVSAKLFDSKSVLTIWPNIKYYSAYEKEDLTCDLNSNASAI